MKTANDIRRTFLDFFAKNGHQIVESSPLVPRNDPTLMFTNAGMVQFKNVFTGAEQRPYSRATTSQKCVRAGGKHNDLDNVGYTARHHTFFEMLGNFSFGDYFKDDAIAFAWNLVTKEFGLPADKLLVTVHSSDEDAAGIWRKVAGLPDDRIIRIPTDDNFWRMGDTGPCGPCSEIFFDHGPHIAGGPPGSPDQDGDRFIEIWNLVFMQYEQRGPDDLIALPKPSIDTGMGLERLAAVLQGKHDNYDIDLMRALIVASAEATKTAPDGAHAVSHRVIADHLRSCCFLIADGVLPSNEGRGYVLRRIMRRAMRHAHMIGAREPLMHRLVPALIQQMGDAYPELNRARALIVETLKLEETRFKQTLERGLRLLEDEVGRLGEGQPLPGDVAFKLYDTYGFPLDLTQDVLRTQGRPVDESGFKAAMDEQRRKARESWAGSGEATTEKLWYELKDELGATEFFGYDTEVAEGKVTAIVKGDARVEQAAAGDEVLVIVNQTPFYGESGGQVGDAGVIFSAEGTEVAVSDTQKKLGAVWAHVGTVTKGTLKVGDVVELRVDTERRSAIRANHSATHLLHEALRRRLGEHVTQKGSLVAQERLRFDISQPTGLTPADIAAVEDEVNRRILGNSEVVTRLMSPDEARASGAMALFGEKYGDEVRVVSMGGPHGELDRDYSIELCGGTHVRRTGDIGLFTIVAEGAVAAGVRRIEALTGTGAKAWLSERDHLLTEAASVLKVRPEDVPSRLAALVDERKKMERELAELRRQVAMGGGAKAEGGNEAKDVAGVKFAARVVEGLPAKDLKPMADELKKQVGSGVVVLIASNEGKASIVVGVTDDLTAKISAVDLVRVGAEALGGKGGGGRPDMAQAGGPDAALAPAAVEAIEKAVAAKAAS
ncbi:alanine--tRNA ligase [Azospirillum brasilense]|uniref:Alanine--tRNA ligase n=2 Tax=Azospirillum brasilense TaxID=192 RepID=A0A0P0F4U3_AZOBR|nr:MULTISPECIES: alanine--tRNA ligase [Azospirillum]ALJ35729.1 alanine--tRNA ligase [Azospirillum brasilense]MDW7554996.1 alanine--tRNA ligase [Azospirillum brasilense]MDW7594773.1 alanine--tRNA ligase [Azospirillum brasilense]MDW7629627.1 alanine--tRNA ligase [Azospirillum brasilense]MDX5954487.1 alanine--tRNA ligase [Azospirillum brasilense]